MYLSRVAIRGFRASGEGVLEVELPGRFSTLIGANSAGKTTVTDGIYLAHLKRFPQLPRFTSAALGDGDRNIEVQYSFSSPGETEGPLGRQMWAQGGRETPGVVAANWIRGLERNLGTINAKTLSSEGTLDPFRLIYLPAWRNPIDELARREARILVELLRAQQQNLGRGRNIASIRARASSLLEILAQDDLITSLESRIGEHLHAISSGVQKNWPYVRGQVVDDAYIARVLEFMLAVIEGRENAEPLDVSGLGYVNLLHIAIVLAAIPDSAASSGESPDDSGASEDPSQDSNVEISPDEAASILRQAQAERESQEDSFFTSSPFHATVVIEEPEAHLHPQLQSALTYHLKQTVEARPELQVILTSHSPHVIASCDPEELVVLRNSTSGGRVSYCISRIPFQDRNQVLRMTRLHLDSSRSSTLFSNRVLLVEGVSDAILAREFGWIWAGDNSDKRSFINALSIVALGTRVGPWSVRLLATRDYELCSRLAVLGDSDVRGEDLYGAPPWHGDHDREIVKFVHCEPTLEPVVNHGNESLVQKALAEINIPFDNPLSDEEVDALFRGQHIDPLSLETISAGRAASRKAEFAIALAGLISDERRTAPTTVTAPAPFVEVFDFLYELQ